MKKKVYYVMDTMCGWCYGFSDVINNIEEKYKDMYDFSVLPGGMWTGEDVKVMNDSLGAYIKDHNQKIEEVTGKKFGEKFNKNILGSTTVVLDSLPGAKAVVVMQRLKKEKTFAFLKAIQEAFFIEGEDVNQLETYLQIGEKFGVRKEIFEKEFLSQAVITETFQIFNQVGTMGAASFPTVILVEGEKGKIISQGHSTFEELDGILSA